LAASGKALEFAFQVLLPDGYKADVHYPLIVYLHHGWSVFRGTDNDGRMFAECPIFAGEQSLTRSPNRTRFPAVFLVPQMVKKETRSGVEHEWGAFSHLDNTLGTVKSAPTPSVSGAFTRKVLDDLLLGALPVAGARLAVDRDRIYLTGHSMGGLGTWDFTERWPELWAAAVPMAGYPDHAQAARVRSLPIWAFHHVKDCYNPVVGTQTMQRQIQTAGGHLVRFTELSFDTQGKCDQAHFRTPEFAWREPELPLWLFSQVRSH
jgi:predicted peptidase